MSLFIQSTVFANNALIPRRFSGEGENVSPPLEIGDVPQGTRELAILCEDPDAPRPEPFVHWLIYGIKPSQHYIPEDVGSNVQTIDNAEITARHGVNSWNKCGYGGPMPPVDHGFHHYCFKLYALNKESKLAPGATKEHFLEAVKDHVIAEAELIDKYRRTAAAAS